jgi:death-associated protein kinase
MGPDLPVTSLGAAARKALCKALDPPEPLGRDWCLLAVSLGLGERLASLESGASSTETPKPSPTARLLEEWVRTSKSATIGESSFNIFVGPLINICEKCIGMLVTRLKELGREDVTMELLHLAPAYRALSTDDCWSDEADEENLLDTSSSNLSR